MKKLILVNVFLVISFLSFAQNYYLGTSSDGVEELYIMSVTSNMTTKSKVVFDRLKPADGKLADFRHQAKMNADKEIDKGKLDKLGYYRRKVQYSCYAKKYRVMEVTYYEIGGKVLDKIEYDEDDAQWKVLPKGSLVEATFKKICTK
jgi:hypothetical protein